MSSHTIIYLDQSYLSNMAKARHGFMKDAREAIFWQSLFDDLKKAVLADRIACPESEFHGTEAMFDKRLERPLINVIDELSMGLTLRSWQDILEEQIIDAASEYLGKHNKAKEWWTIAFESDPNASVKSRMIDVNGTRISAHLFLPKELAERDRQMKLQFAAKEKELLKEYAAKPLNWEELLFESKKSTLDGIMGNTAIQSIKEMAQSRSDLDHLSVRNIYSRLLNLWNKLRQTGLNMDDNKMLQGFGFSRELFNISYVDIYGSIWAAIARAYQGGEPSKGDFYDVPILASVLPYCSVVTTDKSMKEMLVKILHFDDKYGARIFSATRQDRLALQKLIKEILSGI